ncbi:iron-sulfur cluster carrier protein ApbC [Motiliproteus sp. SC1-56]|uniref:iron-sulfur cluster carrier protein ApbC n=1 Tax=Motiliproteus sp. SC1-56 TaxID=2799565 RepID=UPI001A9071EF|nr:iron-sulfur cluster carrier protein ApbC [Motiliproteus sp. SC1-56]
MTAALQSVESVLAAYRPPYSRQSLEEANAIKSLDLVGSQVHLKLMLGYPVRGLEAQLQEELEALLSPLEGVEGLELEVGFKVLAHAAQKNMKSMANVRNIIAVASGKGGVGKSTTTVNLALAMASAGARVGVLDADIYGPSQGRMLGIEPGTRPQATGDAMYPLQVHGIQAMSMSFLVDENQAMVWRGPMASGALQQLITQTRWDDLDYLFVDMPPGTGDIQLTLSQKVPVTGAVIVTTPQDIALLDAKKGIEMFRKVEIPVLGVVENMSLHICSQCGHSEAIFGTGGGEQIAEQYQAELLGRLPLKLSIREQSDAGHPIPLSAPDSEEGRLYRDIALTLSARLAEKRKNYANVFPEIVVQND